MLAKQATERRRANRLKIAIPVFLRGTDRQGKSFVDLATALNVSVGGALLITRRKMEPLTHVSLEVPLSPISATASVPHAARRMEGQALRVEASEQAYLVGVQFTEPLPA